MIRADAPIFAIHQQTLLHATIFNRRNLPQRRHFQPSLTNLPLAAIDILIVLGTIIWMVVAIWSHYRWVALAQVPYLVWVAIATVLQLSITAMNWGRP